MWDAIAGVFTGGTSTLATGVLGVISGLVGGVVTSVTNFKMKKLDMEEKAQDRLHQREMAKLATAQMIQEAQANIQIAREQTKGRVEELEAAAFGKSQDGAATPMFYQAYMKYLVDISKKDVWYSWVAGFTVYLIALMFAATDNLKGSARPILTYYTMGLATYITIIAYDIANKAGMSVNPKQAMEIVMLTTNTILYLAVTSYSWWFADRRAAKFMAKALGWTAE